MLPNNNLVKNPIQLQYFLLADIFCNIAFGINNKTIDFNNYL